MILQFSRSESGASVVSYAMVVGLIALLGVIGVQATGGKVTSIFDASATAVGEYAGLDEGPELPANIPPSVLTTSLPSATAGTAFSVLLEAEDADGDDVTWSSASLPAWLDLSAAGLLSGTPPASGTFDFDVSVADGNGGSNTANLTLSVSAPCVPGNQTFASSYSGPWGSADDVSFSTTWTMPAGCSTLTIEVAGASGAGFGANRNGGTGGYGIVVYDDVPASQEFFVRAGAMGSPSYSAGYSGVFLGASEVRGSALVIAGGGGNTNGSSVGNTSYYNNGGHGGGPNVNGANGYGPFVSASPPTGGTQAGPGAAGAGGTTAGSPGSGFHGGAAPTYGGRGGDGWYGGGGGAAYSGTNKYGHSGAGGSGYANLALVEVQAAMSGGGATTGNTHYSSAGATGNGWVTLSWE